MWSKKNIDGNIVQKVAKNSQIDFFVNKDITFIFYAFDLGIKYSVYSLKTFLNFLNFPFLLFVNVIVSLDFRLSIKFSLHYFCNRIRVFKTAFNYFTRYSIEHFFWIINISLFLFQKFSIVAKWERNVRFIFGDMIL